MSIEYADEARSDLTTAISYLLEHSPAAAEDFYARMTGVVAQLEDRAFEGPEDRLTSGDKVRSWPVYPFRIYYQRKETVLYVLRVYHQAREPIAKRPARRKTVPIKR